MGLRQLTMPVAEPGDATPPAIAETHISWVFFVGDRAYKLKKPVDLGFLDFTTREARQTACHREVALNRRLAPDVYLGVLDVVEENGNPRDHLVEMRRMPDDRRLSTLVLASDPRAEAAVDELAALLARFHHDAVTSDEVAAAATADAVSELWEESLGQLRPDAADTPPSTAADEGPGVSAHAVEAAAALAHRYIAGRRSLFDVRITEGWIRDGHGDLLTDDIFVLDDGPRVLDCLDFVDRFRYGDVLADVCFLVMDLERLGAPQLSRRLLDRWSNALGERHPATLAHHYVAYRALVRAKVAAIRARQGTASAGALARRNLDLAMEHLRAGRVLVVLVGGSPGTGKSTLATHLAAARGWTVLRSDRVRKELAGLDPDTRAPAELGAGLYTEEMTERVYGELVARAERLVSLGEPVVLDATWATPAQRERARALSQSVAAEIVELRCEVSPAVAANRVARRTAHHGSDATPDVAAALARAAHPWPEAHSVDTSGGEEEALSEAQQWLDGRI